MKFSISIFFFLLVFCSCQKESLETTCHVSELISPIEIKFEEGTALNFSFSPFEKDKIFITFKDSKNSTLEYNLTDTTFKSIDRKNWKFRIPSNAPVYVDHIDSTIWIGGNRDFKKISTITNKVTTLPIRQVNRIIPHQSNIYFVARKGFFKWDKKLNSYEKINLPFRNFPTTQLLDKNTLVFGNDLTYDLEKDTWKDGLHIYGYTSKEKSRNFKMAKGIAAFPYGKNKVTLVFPKESKLIGLGNNPKHLNFQLPFIWKNGHKGIIRYNIETNQLDSFRFTLPLGLGRKNKFRFINHKTNTWIFQKGQLFFINTLTSEIFNYKFDTDEKFLSIKVDNCNVYLLFEDKLIIKNQEEFIGECLPYDDKQYLAQLNEFRKFRNSTNIFKDKEEVEVLKKLGIIKSKYANVDHPDIQRELGSLNILAFNSVIYETVSQLETCVRNKKIPFEKRKRCYQNLISKEVRSSNFENAILLEKEFLSDIDSEKLSQEFKYYTSLDSIKKYLFVVDSLEKLNLAEDSLAYKKAIALYSVCRTSYFCHEGCGGCDFSLVTIALQDFIKTYPNSELRDNARFDLIDFSFMYEENFDFENLIRDVEKFIEENPNSDLIDDAQFRILENLSYYIESKKYKAEMLKRLTKFAEDFPESKHIDWVNKKLELVGTSF